MSDVLQGPHEAAGGTMAGQALAAGTIQAAAAQAFGETGPTAHWLTEGPPKFLDALPIAIYACRADGRLLWFNRRAAELWGREPRIDDASELYCGSHRLFLDGREIGRGETPMAQVLSGGAPAHGAQAVVMRPDGSRFWAVVYIDPVKDASGRVIGAVNCFYDITAQKAAEDELREQQQRFAATYDHLDIAISEVDAEGRRLRVNEACCRIMGRSRDKLIGASPFDILHPDETRDEIGQHRRLVAGEIDGYSTENRWLRGDGETIWLSVRCTAVRDENGRFLYAVRVFHDITDSKRVLEALRESEQRQAATYENAAIAISEVDANGRLLRVNETVGAITGYTREELLELSIFEITHPDDRPNDQATFQRQAEAERPAYAVEKRLIRKDGAVIWVNVSSSTVRDAEGRFRYGVRVMRDITERKRAEEVLRNSEQQMRELMAAMPAAIYTTDADGCITFYNQAAEKLWGRAPELGVERWCGSWRLYHADGAPMPLDDCPMAHALKKHEAVRGVEAILERPDGVRVPFSPYPTPMFDSSGALVGAVNMLIDISDRKRAFEIAQRLASIVESSDDAIVSKDLNSTIVTWNEGAKRLFGYSAEETIGQPINIVIPDDRQHEEPGIIARIARGERVDHFDTVRRRKDGSLVNVSLTISPVRNAAGVIVGASKIARDVTERKRAEVRQKALLDELNHRVKNTLATVQSLAAQSIRGAGVSSRVRQSFEGRLFALSRAHDQLSQTQWEAADLRSILRDIFAPFRGEDRSRVQLEGGAVSLVPDAALMLAMVLHELATNAAKYGSLAAPDGRLAVKWSVANGASPPRLHLLWQETGGPPVRKPTRRGFGSRLLDRAITQQLGGSAELAFEPAGVRCQIEIPLAQPDMKGAVG